MSDHLRSIVEEVAPLVLELRHSLHRTPERGHEEHQTTAIIAGVLADNGVAPSLRSTGTGLWADVGPPPKIAFRADIDALPIDEPEDHDPRSENPGWMHACGHDAHAAVAAGIAIVMSRLDLPHGVRFIFQPAEERMPGGARILVAEGLVDGLESIIAFHVNPTLPPGVIGARTGAVTASADGFSIVLEGPGGHTSRPQNTTNLVAVAAQVVAALPDAIREAVDDRIPVVTAFGAIHGGDAANVIPSRLEIKGTVRTGDRALWGEMGELFDSVLGRIISGTGATYQLRYFQGVAPVLNDARVVEVSVRGITRVLGEEAVVPVEMSMGGEDFFEYLDRIPGALLRLGTRSGGGDIHSATFRVNDAALPFGVTAGCAALLELLGTVGSS